VPASLAAIPNEGAWRLGVPLSEIRTIDDRDSVPVRIVCRWVHRHGLEPGDVGGLLSLAAPGSLKANPSSLNN